MKLYYAPGACSLASIIAAKEFGIGMDLIKIQLMKMPRVLPDGTDFRQINPKNYVPALGLDDGTILTEGIAILHYLYEQRSTPLSNGANPPAYRVLEWLTFIATELHKTFSPWLFHPEYSDKAQDVARSRVSQRFDFLEQHLKTNDFLLGEHFSVADGYCFAIARWAPGKDIALSPWPALSRYLERIEARPAVAAALRDHG